MIEQARRQLEDLVGFLFLRRLAPSGDKRTTPVFREMNTFELMTSQKVDMPCAAGRMKTPSKLPYLHYLTPTDG